MENVSTNTDHRFINSNPMQTYSRELKVALNEFFNHNNTNSFNKIAGISSNTSTMLQFSFLCVLQVNCDQESGIAFKKWIRDTGYYCEKKKQEKEKNVFERYKSIQISIFFNFVSRTLVQFFAGIEFRTEKFTSDDEKNVWTDFLVEMAELMSNSAALVLITMILTI